MARKPGYAQEAWWASSLRRAQNEGAQIFFKKLVDASWVERFKAMHCEKCGHENHTDWEMSLPAIADYFVVSEGGSQFHEVKSTKLASFPKKNIARHQLADGVLLQSYGVPYLFIVVSRKVRGAPRCFAVDATTMDTLFADLDYRESIPFPYFEKFGKELSPLGAKGEEAHTWNPAEVLKWKTGQSW